MILSLKKFSKVFFVHLTSSTIKNTKIQKNIILTKKKFIKNSGP